MKKSDVEQDVKNSMYLVVSHNSDGFWNESFYCAEEAMVYALGETAKGNDIAVYYAEYGFRPVC